MVINLRNALFEGSTEKVGGSGLRGMEDAITNLAGVLGAVGARDARLDTVAKRLEFQKPELVRFDSQERDLDMADAITQLRDAGVHPRSGALRDRARAEPPEAPRLPEVVDEGTDQALR